MSFTHTLKTRVRQYALMAVISGAVLISFSGVMVKVAHVAPNVSAFYRFLFGSIALLAAGLYRRELRLPGIRHLLLSLLCGFLLALDIWLFHYSVQYVGPGLGTILPNFQVFILAAFGVIFLKEPLRWTYLISLPLAFIGLFMIVGINWSVLEPTYRLGVYYGMAAAVGYAGFLISLRKLQADEKGASFFYVLMMVSITSAVFVGAEVVVSRASFFIPDPQSFLALAALGLLCHTLGWILIANALPKIRASFSGLILLLQPALAFVWDVIFFHRATALLNWLGVLIALVAIYFGMARKSSSSH